MRQEATRTSAVRGSAHSGLPANDFNDMFTIIHHMVLQQAEVEALNHMRNAAASGHALQQAYRVCVGAVQRLVCIHETSTDSAQETVHATKEASSVVNIEAHLAQYLDATGIVSPLMLWSLAAEIPPGDPLFLQKVRPTCAPRRPSCPLLPHVGLLAHFCSAGVTCLVDFPMFECAETPVMSRMGYCRFALWL